MNKKSLIICIIVVLIIILAIFMIKLNNLGKDDKKNNDIENTLSVESENNSESFNTLYIPKNYEYTTEEVEKIKNEINATANTDIYRIEEEPGGRKILQIKPEIQFNVDLAGIIKNGEPEENELNEILKKIPNTTGIWISNQSRETFLGLLKNNGIRKF